MQSTTAQGQETPEKLLTDAIALNRRVVRLFQHFAAVEAIQIAEQHVENLEALLRLLAKARAQGVL